MTHLTKTAALAIVAALLVPGPAFAQELAPKRSTGTVVKWALIGAAAGAAVGFAVGFNAYDDATYAENRIMKGTLAGSGIGAGVGFAIGLARSRPSAPRTVESRSLWRPDTPLSMKQRTREVRFSWPSAAPAVSPR